MLLLYKDYIKILNIRKKTNINIIQYILWYPYIPAVDYLIIKPVEINFILGLLRDRETVPDSSHLALLIVP